MEQRQARFSNNKYEILLKERNAQRANTSSSSQSLYSQLSQQSSSVVLVGTCQDMCPEFERHERELHFDLSPFEVLEDKEMEKEIQGSNPISSITATAFTSTNNPPRIDHSKAVKKYHRAAAGNETPLPQDVRPLPILRHTMDYLIKEIVMSKCPWPLTLTRDQNGKESNHYENGVNNIKTDLADFITFAEVHAFVRDRTRSIRQDMTLQHLRLQIDCIKIHEECARFHILSGEVLCEMDKSVFDSYQNREQLYKILQSLMEFYDDLKADPEQAFLSQSENKKEFTVTINSNSNSNTNIPTTITNNLINHNDFHNSIHSPFCEAEFRAYYLLIHIDETQLVRDVLAKLNRELLISPPIKFVIGILKSRIKGDFYKFFNLIRNPNTGSPIQDYLLSCLAHFLFHDTRKDATEMMTKAYIKSESFPLNLIREWFLFEDDNELESFFQSLDMEANSGMISFIKSPKSPSSSFHSSSTQNVTMAMRRADRFINNKLFLKLNERQDWNQNKIQNQNQDWNQEKREIKIISLEEIIYGSQSTLNDQGGIRGEIIKIPSMATFSSVKKETLKATKPLFPSSTTMTSSSTSLTGMFSQSLPSSTTMIAPSTSSLTFKKTNFESVESKNISIHPHPHPPSILSSSNSFSFSNMKANEMEKNSPLKYSSEKDFKDLSVVITDSLLNTFIEYFCQKQSKFTHLAHYLCQDLIEKFIKFKMNQLSKISLDKYQENLALNALSMALSEAIIDNECQVICERIIGESLVRAHRLDSSIITSEQLSDAFNRQAFIPPSISQSSRLSKMQDENLNRNGKSIENQKNLINTREKNLINTREMIKMKMKRNNFSFLNSFIPISSHSSPSPSPSPSLNNLGIGNGKIEMEKKLFSSLPHYSSFSSDKNDNRNRNVDSGGSDVNKKTK